MDRNRTSSRVRDVAVQEFNLKYTCANVTAAQTSCALNEKRAGFQATLCRVLPFEGSELIGNEGRV